MSKKIRKQLDVILITARIVDMIVNGFSFFGLLLLLITIYIWYDFNKEKIWN